jgi:fructan beta-fructosidase
LSDFGPAGATGGQWECPELFEVPLEGTSEKRWVMKVGLNPGALEGGSGEQYFIGRFDGARFINDNPASLTLWTDYGKDCYCALTFNHLPKSHAPVMLGWMDNWQYAAALPTSPWRGQMTIPRRLSLRKTGDGIRLIQEPIEGLATLREPAHSGTEVSSHSFEIRSEMHLGKAQEIGWKLLADDGTYTLVGYDRAGQKLFVDRTHSGLTQFNKDFPARTEAPLKLGDDVLRLHILVDRCSVEVFAQDGAIAMTDLVFPPAEARRVEIWTKGGQAPAPHYELAGLRSVW